LTNAQYSVNRRKFAPAKGYLGKPGDWDSIVARWSPDRVR